MPIPEFIHAYRRVLIPATPAATVCWLRGVDRSDQVHLLRSVASLDPGQLGPLTGNQA